MKRHACVLSRFSDVQLFATLWTIACQAPAHGILRQEYWCGLPSSLPEDLPNPETKPTSPVAPALQVILYFRATVMPSMKGKRK